MWEKTAYFAPSHYPDCINKSALWTSVSACIMDDIAEGPEKQRDWVPGRDNEPPFSRGKCGEALVTSISNLSKSETNLANAGPRLRPDVDGGKASAARKWIHFDLQSFNISVDRSEAVAGGAAWSSPYLSFITCTYKYTFPFLYCSSY